jgi:hypothetical protein
MTYKIKDRHHLGLRVLHFIEVNAEKIPPGVAALQSEIQAAVDRIEAADSAQAIGTGLWRSESATRQTLARQLRQALVDVARFGRILARTDFPGLREKLRLKRKLGYTELEAVGTSFVEVLSPLKPTFIARGYAPEFLDEITALVAALRDTALRKAGGRMQRTEGTAGLDEAARDLAMLVREFDAILISRVRRTNPALLAEWKATLRLPKRAQATAPTRAVSVAAPVPASEATEITPPRAGYGTSLVTIACDLSSNVASQTT